MSFSSGRHWVRNVIENKYLFLCLLIDFFNDPLRQYECEMIYGAQRLAKEIANGDEEIERSEIDKLLASFYDCQDNRNLFYQSMLIMGYSYYESSRKLIGRELKKQGQDINDFNINLKSIQSNKDLIESDVRLMRNFLVHNNSVEPHNGQEEAIKRLQSKYQGIICDGIELAITSADCVVDSLNKEYSVLKYYCKLVGFN